MVHFTEVQIWGNLLWRGNSFTSVCSVLVSQQSTLNLYCDSNLFVPNQVWLTPPAVRSGFDTLFHEFEGLWQRRHFTQSGQQVQQMFAPEGGLHGQRYRFGMRHIPLLPDYLGTQLLHAIGPFVTLQDRFHDGGKVDGVPILLEALVLLTPKAFTADIVPCTLDQRGDKFINIRTLCENICKEV
ncbi:hypothetical protein EYZ11_007152 [Aspergillus tanneri]|uniref:Uncharacterized protein n=1 Tax=Aspergillus tanneri TaxID=1220188 RepID=A0A4S3JDY1_9EURO|nr:hypothetical protein EYZ11_007152 [Aspergillus tanneri]